MEERNKIAISIGGWDPCGGAGLAADIKTFEMLNTIGMGVCSAVTVQTEDRFKSVNWVDPSIILDQLDVLLQQYQPSSIKIGIIESLALLHQVIQRVSSVPIIWDPVLSASAGFQFHEQLDQQLLHHILKRIHLITPNADEISAIFGNFNNPEQLQSHIVKNNWCPVLYKGGHAISNANDILITPEHIHIIEGDRFENPGKHGSGCVLSAAIAAHLSKGKSLVDACQKGKSYVETFILSSSSLLGFHPKRFDMN